MSRFDPALQGLIEKMGTGINRMRNWMTEAGLQPPEFRFTTFFTVIFLRPKPTAPVRGSAGKFGAKFGVKFGVNFGVKGKRARRMASEIEALASGGPFDTRSFAQASGVSARTVETDLKFLKQHELVTREGSDKTGRYILTAKGKSLIAESEV